MRWFNAERTKELLTFPVVTVSLLNDGNKILDKEYYEFIANELSEGNSFFIYSSKSVDSLSSCCFSGDQKCLTKSSSGVNYMTFKELHESSYNNTKRNFTIFHNGSWVKGREVILPKRKMYKVTTVNNKEIIVSDNHMNPTDRGDILACKLTTDDYLLFNTRPLDSVKERDENLSYKQGFIVGAFLGNGSFGSGCNGTIYETTFSMNHSNYQKLKDILDTVANNKAIVGTPYNNIYSVRVSDSSLVAFIQRWTNWERGTYSYNKELNLDCLLQSKEFRLGILEGWYHTDGGNSNRCYTTSSMLAETMEVLITSLGMQSIIDVSDRTDESVVIRDKTYNRNYPLYCVRWYNPHNKRTMKDVYKIINNSIYFKIKSIEEVNYDDDSIYCFEMSNIEEPYFTLPNGIITHNCRLRNSIEDQINDFSYSLGAGGVMTGSMNVITLNMNRFIQNVLNKEEYDEEKHLPILLRELKRQIRLIHKYQLGFKYLFKDFELKGMMPAYSANFITLDKQYLTVGINGLIEGAEYLGYTVGNNEKYKSFISTVMKTISDTNKETCSEIANLKINTEMVPAENLGVKFAKWDKKDGYVVTRDCYNSYFYIVEDEDISVIDKFVLHGDDTTKYLDGGK